MGGAKGGRVGAGMSWVHLACLWACSAVRWRQAWHTTSGALEGLCRAVPIRAAPTVGHAPIVGYVGPLCSRAQQCAARCGWAGAVFTDAGPVGATLTGPAFKDLFLECVSVRMAL